LIALSAINFIFNGVGNSGAFPPGSNGPPVAVMVFMSLGALAVSIYWGFWWYKKKSYFESK
jgi:hypothetical protein